MLHFRSHQMTCFNGKKLHLYIILTQIIYETNIKYLYSSIEIFLRIFVLTPATNRTTDRLFSSLKILKNYIQSTMLQERLNSSAILCRWKIIRRHH